VEYNRFHDLKKVASATALGTACRASSSETVGQMTETGC